MSLAGMNSHLVNIPRDMDDVFYRYKMPSLVTKIDGRGNSFRTTLLNLPDVAKALCRPPSYIIKYMGYELGVPTSKCADSAPDAKWILKGKHDQEVLANLLDDFIKKYVLCERCRLPETDLVLARNGTIKLRCYACGHVYSADGTHKLASFIRKNPPVITKSSNKGKTATADHPGRANQLQSEPSPKSQHLDPESGEDNDDWAVDTSPEAVEKRRHELLSLSLAK